MSTTLIHNVRLAGETEPNSWILIEDRLIAAVGHGLPSLHADQTVDGKGALALPGVIDCHVHFREPGMTHKADIATESRAAIAGGVTSYLEMPNTTPPTTTIERWQQKMELGAEKSFANYAFFIGATNNNLHELEDADYTRVPGVKLFMGSSTGDMLVDDDSAIAQIFRNVKAIVAVHAEDQGIISKYTKLFKEGVDGDDLPIELHSNIRSIVACYKSSQHAVELAKKYKHRLHLCHLSTMVELSLLEKGDPATKLVTSEVSPHHLMWSVEDYPSRGSRIKMNPSVKELTDQMALRQAVIDGRIDIVATDHAPHLLKEKEGGALKAMSGAPLVQFSLTWMLDNFDEATVQRVMCENPAKVYHIDRRGTLQTGNYADITLVQKVSPYMVEDSQVISKCGWTPLRGYLLQHEVQETWVNGSCAYRKGKFSEGSSAMPLVFGYK